MSLVETGNKNSSKTSPSESTLCLALVNCSFDVLVGLLGSDDIYIYVNVSVSSPVYLYIFIHEITIIIPRHYSMLSFPKGLL